MSLLISDVDECLTENCGQNSGECVNLINHGFNCTCNSGFEWTPIYEQGVVKCVDIDECLQGDIQCVGDNEICLNGHGNFTCSCNIGYERVTPGSDDCTDIDECMIGTATCSALCTNTVGGFQCSKYNNQVKDIPSSRPHERFTCCTDEFMLMFHLS